MAGLRFGHSSETSRVRSRFRRTRPTPLAGAAHVRCDAKPGDGLDATQFTSSDRYTVSKIPAGAAPTGGCNLTPVAHEVPMPTYALSRNGARFAGNSHASPNTLVLGLLELGLHRTPEGRSGARQPGHDASDRDAQHVGQLLVREALDLTQDE